MPAFSNKWTPLLMAVICGILVWNHFRDREAPPSEMRRPLPKIAPAPPPAPVETAPPAAEVTPVPPDATATAMPGVLSPAPATTAPANTRPLSGSAREDSALSQDTIDSSEALSAVDSAIRDYHAVHGENPIGSNAEITTALFINNPKQIKLEVPAGSSINAEGQLCDRWGTPYFFHQLSASEMQIRSAGPDREMWTGDDSHM